MILQILTNVKRSGLAVERLLQELSFRMRWQPRPDGWTRRRTLAWLALAGVLFGLPTALEAQLRGDAGLTLYEYLVMAALSQAPDRTRRMSELAELTNGSLPRLSQVATKLEGQGWVRRRADPKDGRVTLAVLTKAGFRKVEESAPGHVETLRRLVFDPLSRTQVRQLFDILHRIERGLDPAHTSVTTQAIEEHSATVRKRPR